MPPQGGDRRLLLQTDCKHLAQHSGCCRLIVSAEPAGAKASANLYSLVETAKANGLEPYAYLRRVFTELPQAQTLEDIEALLPYQKPDEQTTLQAISEVDGVD
jgi:hypothetical protein